MGFMIYRDHHHLDQPNGKYTALSTMMSSLTGIQTSDIIYEQTYTSTLNTALRDLSNEVVWHGLTSDSRTKIIREPTISITRKNELIECNYIGLLEVSQDLLHWEAVGGASSPHRINMTDKTKSFFRSVQYSE